MTGLDAAQRLEQKNKFLKELAEDGHSYARTAVRGGLGGLLDEQMSLGGLKAVLQFVRA